MRRVDEQMNARGSEELDRVPLRIVFYQELSYKCLSRGVFCGNRSQSALRAKTKRVNSTPVNQVEPNDTIAKRLLYRLRSVKSGARRLTAQTAR